MFDRNEKQLKGIRPLVEKVKEEQEKIRKEHKNDTTEEFIRFARQKTAEYKIKVQEKLKEIKEKNKDVLGEGHVDQIKEFNKKVQIERQKILDEILPEAYALVRETARRTLKAPDGQPMEPFDVQVVGGIALHWGRVTEMATGEGKTLVATLPAYLNALTGEGVHIVTVNEYLAQRDARWMGTLYDALGISVGVNLSATGMDKLKKEAHAADITYGTNSEFGFDYLRDNMEGNLEEKVQRGHHFAIVDEVDSILIDESRTPLVISSPVDSMPVKQYKKMNPRIKKIVKKQRKIIGKKTYHVKMLFEQLYKDYIEKDGKELILSDLAEKIQKYSIVIHKLNPYFLSQKIKKDKLFKKLYKNFDQTYFKKPDSKTFMQKIFWFLYESKKPKKLRGAKKVKFETLVQKMESIFENYKTFADSKISNEKVGELKRNLGYLLLQIYKGNPKNDLIKKDLEVNKLFKEAFKEQEYEDVDKKTKLEDKDLFFILSEKEQSVVLTEKGWNKIYGKSFEIPNPIDLDEELGKIERSRLPVKEKEEKKKEVEKAYASKLDFINAVDKLLKAYNFYKKDTNYIVFNDREVIIVDRSTGRIMPGKRYSDGLHEAIEAKEGVEIKQASQVSATIAYQNYFRMYSKLAGMTGTAETEKDEFLKIYNMDTIVIPTNKPLDRKEYNDIIYLTERAKFDAVIKDIAKKHEKGRPILVGTASIEKSNKLSEKLKQLKIPHRVLNASRTVDMTEKLQGKVSEAVSTESEIVKRAGERGAVTISTNMAGRGTDIILGYHPELLIQDMKKEAETYPNKEKEYVAKLLIELSKDAEFLEQYPEFFTNMLIDLSKDAKFLETEFKDVEKTLDYEEVLEKIAYYKAKKEKAEVVKLGGLHVIGTERHEARRIDNQLRGRAGRQGDPGSSIFYLSLEDPLWIYVGVGDKLKNFFERVGVEEDEPIAHKIITKSIQGAQKRLEENHFADRKHLLSLDDTNDQLRRIVYRERDFILGKEDLKDYILSVSQDVLGKLVDECTDEKKFSEEWDWHSLEARLYQMFGIENLQVDKEDVTLEKLKEQLNELMVKKYENRGRAVLKASMKGELKNVKKEYQAAVKVLKEKDVTEDERRERKMKQFKDDYKAKVLGIKAKYENPAMRERAESFLNYSDKATAISELDEKWKSFLGQSDLLKEGIGLVGWGQKDPVIEYRRKSFDMFDDFIDDVKQEVVQHVFRERYN